MRLLHAVVLAIVIRQATASGLCVCVCRPAVGSVYASHGTEVEVSSCSLSSHCSDVCKAAFAGGSCTASIDARLYSFCYPQLPGIGWQSLPNNGTYMDGTRQTYLPDSHINSCVTSRCCCPVLTSLGSIVVDTDSNTVTLSGGPFAGAMCPSPGPNSIITANITSIGRAVINLEGLPAAMGQVIVKTPIGFMMPGIYQNLENDEYGCFSWLQVSEEEINEPFPTWAVLVIVASFLVLLALMFVGVFVWRRKRRRQGYSMVNDETVDSTATSGADDDLANTIEQPEDATSYY